MELIQARVQGVGVETTSDLNFKPILYQLESNQTLTDPCTTCLLD